MVTKRFLSIFVIVSLFFASLFIASCGGGDNDFIQTEPEQDRVEITSENPIISPPNIVEVSSETPSTVSIHFLPAQVDGLLKIENYLVYISTDKESLFNENSQPAVILNPDELSTKIENLSPETKYYVAVIAKTTNGFKRISNIMEITTISSENILRDDVNIPAVEYLNASDLIIVEEDKEFILDRDLQIGSLIVVEDIENLVYELYKIEDIKPHEIDKYKAVVSKQNVSELFKSLSISTKVNMIDLPQNIESQNTGRISVLFLNSSEGNNITYDWKDGFIMQNIFYGKNITSKKISAASEKEEVAEDGDYICYKKHTDDYEVNFCLPKNFKVGQTYKIPIDVSLIKDYRYKESGFTSNLPSGFVEYFSYKCSEYNRSAGYFDNLYQFVWKYYASVRYDAECMIKKDARIDVCSFEFKRIFPTDEDLERDSYAPIYYLERLNEIPVVKEENGKLYFLWTPNHLDSFGGYSYRFKIKAGVFCEYEDMKHEFDELEFETDIVFTSDAYRIDSIQNVSFSDEVDIGNLNIEYSLSPELDIYYDKGKKYARVGISVNPFLKVSMEGSFEEESGKLFGPFPLLSKQFVKIVPTTVGVPIVVITRLNLMATAELKTSANFTGLIEGTASGSLGYTIEIKDGEINSPSSENTMTVNLVAKGTSNVVADLKLHMYPSIEVSLYDAVGTQLVLDPYLYSNLSLMTEGVSYTELWLYDNGNDFYYHNNQYFDYWFENIEVGGALDAYFFAGIDWVFLEYSYPKDARWASHDLPIAAASFMNPKHRVFLKKYYFDILGYENIKNAIGESAALNLINEIDSKISDDKYKENLNTNYSGYKKFSIFKYPFIVLPEFSITFKPEEKPPTYINSTAIKVVSSSADFDLKNLRYIEKIIKDDNGNYWVVPDFNIVSVSGEISLRGVNSGTFRQIDDESMSIELDDSGVALYWLNRYGISSLDLDKDLDGDGFSNKEEFFAGTDPTDKTSTPYPYIYSIVENNSLTEIPIYDEQIFQDYVTVTAGREITLDTLVVLPRSYDGDTNVEILSPDGNVLQNCNIPNDNLLNVDLPFFDKELFQLCKFTIRPETSGYYTITLNFTDGNDKEFIYLKVVEEDTIHPEIILKGDNPLYLNLGEIYEEPGYEAVDNVDGDITHKVLVVEDVDETKEGEYKITYLVKDSAGNEATQSRTVIVQKPTNRPPIITNITPDTTINYGDTVLLEVTAYDPEGSGLTITWSDNGNTVRSCISSSCTVKVEPTMDTIYTVDVQDFEGNTITKSVSIKVKQPEYFLQLDAYLNPITIDVLEGYTQNITLTVSTSYENLSNLKCWYELNNVRKDINCNTSVSIPVDVSLTGTNYIEVFAQGITPDNKTYTASKTLTLTVNVKEKNYTLTFISENYPDDTVFNINEDISSIDKRWTFRMTDTHGATLIVEKDSSKPCNLEINGSLPQITVNPSEEFDINISFVFPAKEGEFECYFKIRDTEGNYYNTDSVDSFWIKFKVVANSLIASINTNAKTVLINEPVYLIISIKDGNPPYTVDINWGDGNADSFEFSETEKVVAHTYTIEGNHRITATIVDNAGKTYETNIDISVSSQVQQQTQWTGKVTKNTDTTIEIPADITVTPKTTADGATYYEYSINYTPTNPDEIYYSSYTLPVPKDVLNLSNGKIRITYILVSGNIPYYDRELWISTDLKKFGIVPIDIGYYNELQTAEGYGIYIEKDLQTGQVVKENHQQLSDSYGANQGSVYIIELDTGSMSVYRYENSTTNLILSKSVVVGNYITELSINNRGNGKVDLVIVEQDIDNDGTYDKKLILNTENRIVNWSLIPEQQLPTLTNIISGTVIWNSIPDNLAIRITPDIEMIEGNWGGIVCKVSKDGTFGDNCVLYGNESNFTPDHKFQIIVFLDKNGDFRFDKDESSYFGLENAEYRAWERIEITLGDIAFLGNIELDSWQYIPELVIVPNETTCWQNGKTVTIQWDNTKIVNGTVVNILILYDDPSGIDDTSPDVNIIASKNWQTIASKVPNTGSYELDASLLGGNGNAYKLLIISDRGEWGLSKGLFSLNVCDNNPINSSGIENCIRQTLGLSDTEPLTDEKLLTITSLNCISQDINDITLLSNLTNLQSLYLSFNQISDISALSSLTNLRSLDLRYNQISDISALSSLTNLQWLNLGGNQISDISGLSNLINLQYLGLYYNNINDITLLSNLTNLQSLYLSFNQISDISALSSLTNLQSLDLSGNCIANFTPVEFVPNCIGCMIEEQNQGCISP